MTPRKRKRASVVGLRREDHREEPRDESLVTTPSRKAKRVATTTTAAVATKGRKFRGKSAASEHAGDASEIASEPDAERLIPHVSDDLVLETPTRSRARPKITYLSRKQSKSHQREASHPTNEAENDNKDSDSDESAVDSTRDPDYKALAEEDEMDDEAVAEEEETKEADEVNDENELEAPEPKTPSRRRTAKSASPRKGTTTPRRARVLATPTKPRRTSALAKPTPHSKAALRKRRSTALAVRPPPAVDVGALELNWGILGDTHDPWLRAMHVLHVAARPDALPCREEEYGRVLRAVEELLEEGSGGCVCRYQFIHACTNLTLYQIFLDNLVLERRPRCMRWYANSSEWHSRTSVDLRTHLCSFPLMSFSRKPTRSRMWRSMGSEYRNQPQLTAYSGRLLVGTTLLVTGISRSVHPKPCAHFRVISVRENEQAQVDTHGELLVCDSFWVC